MRILSKRFDFDARSLLLLGGLFLPIGLSIIGYHPLDPELFHTRLPVPLRVAIWVTTGTLAIIGAFIGGRVRFVAFGGCFIGPAHRTLSYLWAMLRDVFTPGDRFDPQHFAFFVVWLLVTLLILHLARGDEDAKRPPVVVHTVIPEGVRADLNLTAENIKGLDADLKVDGGKADE